MKTLLILVDGMRPDALTNVAPAQELMKKSSYAMDAQTVFPSVTLPCHMSLFHSVDPGRHGTTDNVYAPQVPSKVSVRYSIGMTRSVRSFSTGSSCVI